MNRVAAIENKSGRYRHREGREPAHVPADERLEFHREMNGKDAGQHDRQPDGPEVSAEERLGNEKDIKVEGPVIMGRVVAIEAVLDHLVDEPAVDPLVEMRRFDGKEKEA